MVLGPATLLAPPDKAANEDRVVYLWRGVMGARGGNSLSESESLIGEGEVYSVASDFAPFLPTHFCQLLSSSLGIGMRVAE